MAQGVGSNEVAMTEINWKRRFVRGWMVLSAIWIVIVMSIFIVEDGGSTGLINFIGTALGPPIIFFVIGMVIDWISRGFFSTKTD